VQRVSVVLLCIVVAIATFRMRESYWMSSEVNKMLEACGDPCFIRYNEGGYVAVALEVADQIVRNDKHLIIDGVCASACVLLADKARPNVCITKRALMSLHEGEMQVEVWGFSIYSWPVTLPHSKDIDIWVKERGGYPKTKKLEKFLHMPYEDAKQFWKTCA